VAEAEEAEEAPSWLAAACRRAAAIGKVTSEFSVCYDVISKILSRRERVWFMFNRGQPAVRGSRFWRELEAARYRQFFPSKSSGRPQATEQIRERILGNADYRRDMR